MKITKISNEQLAQQLDAVQVDGVILVEASRRLKSVALQHALTAVDITAAVHASPLVDARTSEVIEQIVMSVPMSRKTSKRLGTLAGRILDGRPYTHEDVLSLAASVLSQVK